MHQRQILRQQLRDKRAQVAPIAQLTASIKIADLLSQHLLFKNSQTIAGYFSVNNEINPQPLLELAWQKNKTCYLPVVADKLLQFHLYQPNDHLRKNHFDIPEPTSEKIINPQELDLILVPLVAVDQQGTRLGMGAGYYDRTFSFLLNNPKVNKPYLVGLAYDWQIVEKIDVEEWDVPLDAVVTETRITTFNKNL